MTYNYDEIGKRLRALRKEWGYSLDKLAAFCEVQQYQTISKWETANTIPSIKQLMKLCDLYGCDIGYLLGEYDCKTRKATDIHKETGLSEEAIKRLQYLSVSNPDMVRTISLLIEFNNSDIIELIKSYLKFNLEKDIDIGPEVIKGQALGDIYLLEINAELKTMKNSRRVNYGNDKA